MDFRTLPQLLKHAAETYDKPDALLSKRAGAYVAISHRDLRREAEALAYGLLALGLERGDRVALMSENRPGWVMADMAILAAGGLTVPIYPTLAADAAGYILRDSEARLAVVSTLEQLDKALAARPGTALERLVTIDPVHHADPSVLSLRQVAALGQAKRTESPDLLAERLQAIDPNAVATVLYTSGTTGRPKGVMLSHENILSNVRAALSVLELGPADVCLSFLPLSHSFERMAGYYAMLAAGATIAYAESIETVAQNMLEVRPTVMNSVPRLYEKIYARVTDAALEGPTLRRRIFLWARGVGERAVDRRFAGRRRGPLLALQHALAGRLVFSRLRERTGGRLRFFCSGGAPLSPTIARFFWAADLPILEGYGLTETSPIITVNTFSAARLGTVGRPLPGIDVTIAEDGEILCRGPNVMLGYYRMPEETAAVIQDGWFRTGDVGHFDPEGFLVITDRKKDLIKTSGGKYVAPQPIESSLKSSKFVSQAVVVGNRRKYASALIVPKFENLRRYARQAGIPFEDDAELLERPQVGELFQELIDEVNRGLSSYEAIKRFRLLREDFSVESGELTPTLKAKRNVIERKYVAEVDSMYEEKLEV